MLAGFCVQGGRQLATLLAPLAVRELRSIALAPNGKWLHTTSVAQANGTSAKGLSEECR